MSGDLYFEGAHSWPWRETPMYDLREREHRTPMGCGETTKAVHEVVRTYHDSYIAALVLSGPIAYRWAHGRESLPSWMVKCLILLKSGQAVVRYMKADDLDCDDMISYECE